MIPQLMEPHFRIIWAILGKPLPMISEPAEVWNWCIKVFEVFQKLHREDDNEPSIESAYDTLVSDSQNIKGKENNMIIDPQQKSWVVKAIFAALCWISATITPLGLAPESEESQRILHQDASRKSWPRNARSISLVAKNTYRTYSSKDLRRPVSKLFYAFRSHGKHISESQHGNDVLYSTTKSERQTTQYTGRDTSQIPAQIQFDGAGGEWAIDTCDNHVLYESNLNYFSLFTIGRVKLKWVDTITAHLAFDRITRTLSVFCFPSFCAVRAMDVQGNIKVVSEYVSVIISMYSVNRLRALSSVLKSVIK